MPRPNALMLLFAANLAVDGCATYHRVDPRAAARSADVMSVRVHLKDGSRVLMRNARVTDDSVRGSTDARGNRPVGFPLSDVTLIEHEKVDVAPTVALAVLVGLVIVGFPVLQIIITSGF